MNRYLSYVAVLLAGLIVGAIVANWLSGGEGGVDHTEEAKPLYWVAPMDANYRRDEPGKSPMGMDLVPVYADEAGTHSAGPGTIRIAPEVVNNLGVRTASVRRGQLPSTIRTVGYVQYDEDRMQHIHSRVEGWVERLHLKAEGDPVKRGEPLYDLYAPQLVNAQEELLLALGRNNARLIQAARSRLSALGFSQSSIDRLQRSRKVQQNVTVYAPQSGVIDNLKVREGFFVKPDMTMMGIAQLESVWVVGEVFERQAGQIEVGDEVQMGLDYLPNRQWHGRVEYIYPSLNPRTRTLQLRMRFDNVDGALKPNMYAQLTIQTKPDSPAILVPREALIRVANQSRVVLALDQGRFKSVAVEVGRVGESYAQVRRGLEVGDEVVVSAQFLLDSESSKSSDFKRMGSDPDPAPDAPVWTAAVVKAVMLEQSTLSLTHDPVPAWKWPAMTMDFSLGAGVDARALETGQQIAIRMEKTADGGVRVIEIATDPAQVSSSGQESPNQQSTDHSEMNHDSMDHGSMNHETAEDSTSPSADHQH